MPFRESGKFTAAQEALAGFARVLGHPARVAIVHYLRDREEATCGEVVAAMPLAQATVSQHLGELRRAGLLEARTCGTRICYRLRREVMEAMCATFRSELMGEAEKEPNTSL